MSLFSIIVIKDRQKIIEWLQLLVVALKVSSYKHMSMQARASYHLCKKGWIKLTLKFCEIWIYSTESAEKSLLVNKR